MSKDWKIPEGSFGTNLNYLSNENTPITLHLFMRDDYYLRL